MATRPHRGRGSRAQALASLRMALDFDPIAAAGKNWRENKWPAADAMVLATSVTRVHQIVLGRINAALAPFDVSFSRFEVLALLFFARENELPMGKIGDRLQVHPTSVTSLINRLSADGLVERVTHPTDGRSRLVRLTAQGSAIAEQCAVALGQCSFGVDGLPTHAWDSVIDAATEMRLGNGDWR